MDGPRRFPPPKGWFLPISFSLDTGGAGKAPPILRSSQSPCRRCGQGSADRMGSGFAKSSEFLPFLSYPRCPAKKIWDMLSPEGETWGEGKEDWRLPKIVVHPADLAVNRKSSAFTLLEVIIACAIFFMVAFAILNLDRKSTRLNS